MTMRLRHSLWLALLMQGGAAMAADIDALWDFNDPAASEARFREELKLSKGEIVLTLRTQIARTFSLRGRFDDAHAELDAIEPLLAQAGPEPRVRTLLERGRTLRSAKKPSEARPFFMQAFELADRNGLQALAADALHMVALVEPTPEGQLEWNRKTADYARAAGDARAQRWQAPALNNIGDALRSAKRYDEALAAFKQAQSAYEKLGRADDVRIARWQVANTLSLMGCVDEALAMQLALEKEFDAAGAPDPYVFEELARLYEARGDVSKAQHYRALQKKHGG
jgi:tetratricopeptide (TPR) repeat protein